MSFLKNLAALAIRTQVLSLLREKCPPRLSEALETLLAQSQAVAAIQDLVAANLKTPTNITEQAVLQLQLPEAARTLLNTNPELLSFLVSTARARLGA